MMLNAAVRFKFLRSSLPPFKPACVERNGDREMGLESGSPCEGRAGHIRQRAVGTRVDAGLAGF
jgi:hypothetical protein